MPQSLVVVRLRVPAAEAAGFRAEATEALNGLAASAGFLAADLARSVDEPEMWLLRVTFDGIGSCRRALSGREATIRLAPLWRRALDEPSTFEVLASAGPSVPSGAPGPASDRAADADTVGLGAAAAPRVSNDLD